MGTYGDFTGIVRWFDKANQVGKLLGLNNGEIEAYFDSDGTIKWAGGYGVAAKDKFEITDPDSSAFFRWALNNILSYDGTNDLSYDGTNELVWSHALLTWKAANTELNADGTLTATDATLSGTITATAGSIGGWTINSTYLAKDTGTDATSVGLAPSDYPFYAGATYANRATAPFRVTPAGTLTASSAVITGSLTTGTGSSIDGTYLTADSVTATAITVVSLAALTASTGDLDITGTLEIKTGAYLFGDDDNAAEAWRLDQYGLTLRDLGADANNINWATIAGVLRHSLGIYYDASLIFESYTNGIATEIAEAYYGVTHVIGLGSGARIAMYSDDGVEGHLSLEGRANSVNYYSCLEMSVYTGGDTRIGLLGATPIARQSHIADPSGGITIDSEARTAIISILSLIESFGFAATS